LGWSLYAEVVGFVVFCAGIGLMMFCLAGLIWSFIGSRIGIQKGSGTPLEAARRHEIDPMGIWFAVRYRNQLLIGLAASVPITILGVVLANV
jgi:hypothetical protein